MRRQIVADVLNIPIHIPEKEQVPAYGATLLAMRGCGVADVVSSNIKQVVRPCHKQVEAYEKKYRIFQNLYPVHKKLAAKLC